MIGALIGDIAAWTYEHDKDTFWKQLIPDRGRGAETSVYGHALMRAASNMVRNNHSLRKSMPRVDILITSTIYQQLARHLVIIMV